MDKEPPKHERKSKKEEVNISLSQLPIATKKMKGRKTKNKLPGEMQVGEC